MWVKGENDWVYKFPDGDKMTFDEVYELNHRVLYSFIIGHINNNDAAEDLTIETFQILLKSKAEFVSSLEIRPYLFGIARNIFLNYLKAIDKNWNFKAEMAYLSNGNTSDLNQEIIRAETSRIIDQEIDRLPPQQRQVFKMIFFEGLKPKQVAELMGIAPNTVRSTKNAALKSLRIALLSKNISLLSLLFQVLIILFSSFSAFF